MKVYAAIAALLAVGTLAHPAHAGEAAFSCTAEAIGTDGKAKELSAVRYFYGKDKALYKAVDLPPASCGKRFTGLDAGVWYFEAATVAKDGSVSKHTDAIAVTIDKVPPVAPSITLTERVSP